MSSLKMIQILTTFTLCIVAVYGHSHSLPYSKCPPGWISLSESIGCILYHTEACGGFHGPGCSWVQAMEECQKEKSWLLEISSVEQQDFVVKMAKALEVVKGPMCGNILATPQLLTPGE